MMANRARHLVAATSLGSGAFGLGWMVYSALANSKLQPLRVTRTFCGSKITIFAPLALSDGEERARAA